MSNPISRVESMSGIFAKIVKYLGSRGFDCTSAQERWSEGLSKYESEGDSAYETLQVVLDEGFKLMIPELLMDLQKALGWANRCYNEAYDCAVQQGLLRDQEMILEEAEVDQVDFAPAEGEDGVLTFRTDLSLWEQTKILRATIVGVRKAGEDLKQLREKKVAEDLRIKNEQIEAARVLRAKQVAEARALAEKNRATLVTTVMNFIPDEESKATPKKLSPKSVKKDQARQALEDAKE